MTTAAVAAPPAEQAEALELAESAVLAIEEGASSPVAADGTVLMHIIRPGIGKGRGRHLYEADMLREHAQVFGAHDRDGRRQRGWKMYVDHRSPEAKKAAGGLPRSLRDTGGIIKESWWDDSVPADADHGQGAVVGRVKPVSWVRDLIETDPELVEASIAATATGVRAVNRDGQRVWLVEGINPRGSVDFVTEAGAGGRVAPLLEAYDSEVDAELLLEVRADEDLGSLTDDDFLAYVRENRPNLIESLGDSTDPEKEADVSGITAQALAEALAASPNVLVEALATDEAKAALTPTVEALVEARTSTIKDEAQATVARVVELTKLEREARDIIEATNLPDSWKSELRERYQLDEAGVPSEHLDVFDETDEFGGVSKPARQVLREALEADIASEQTKLREARPTAIRGQGGAGGDVTGEEGAPAPIKSAKAETTWGRFLQESGVDADKAYHLTGAAAEAEA